jgi:hypothetical protein
MKRCHGHLHYDRKFQIFIFLIGYINVNKGVFCLIISYLRIKSYNVLHYNNCLTDWNFPLISNSHNQSFRKSHFINVITSPYLVYTLILESTHQTGMCHPILTSFSWSTDFLKFTSIFHDQDSFFITIHSRFNLR